jgi:bifunctional non-homologous end joining protein LigD
MRPDLAPMLASTGRQPFDDDGWLFEVKWDGVRALAVTSGGAVRLVSRQGNDVTAAYPELARLADRVGGRDVVLDGEIIALGEDGRPSFHALQHRMHTRGARTVEDRRAAYPVTYMVFDVLAVGGEALVDRPLRERIAVLDEVLTPGGAVQRSAPSVLGTGIKLYEAVSAAGLEGVIAKRLASVYRPGQRTRDWLKLKIRRSCQCVIGGWLPGQGHRATTFASLLVGVYDDAGGLFCIGQVGSGFTDPELRRVRDLLDRHATERMPFAEPPELSPPPYRRRDPGTPQWVEPLMVCRVDYGELTESVRLRAPSYAGLVAGADPAACLLSDVEGRAGPAN